MIFYAVIDTNVLVSAMMASQPDSATVEILRHITVTGKIVPLYSNEIMTEYREVLKRPKFKFEPAFVDEILDALKAVGVNIMPESTGERLPDPKDTAFYEVVMDTRDLDSRLVTGNIKHFPKKTFIVTPREMIDLIQGQFGH